MNYPKRLIEVDLPIKRISEHARREKSIRHGHISTLHIWWARRPLAACRAVICAALWPDPADPLCPKDFRNDSSKIITEFAKKAVSNKDIADNFSPEAWKTWNKLSRKENKLDISNESHLKTLRNALLDFIGDFANWDNSTVNEYLETSRALTQSAHEALGGNTGTGPLIVDTFAGGGSIPLEALRIGADAVASDLNPIAVLLNKVMIEYIPKYGQQLADEVRKWGQIIKECAEKELGEIYPKDLDGSIPIAYLWARTVNCEGPNCGTDVPLIRSLWLSKKDNQRVALHLIPNLSKKNIDIEIIELKDHEWVNISNSKLKVKNPKFDGTVKRGSVTCPVCGYTTPIQNLKKQLLKRNGGTVDAKLLSVVMATKKGKKFKLPEKKDFEAISNSLRILKKKKNECRTSLSFVPNEDTTKYHSFVNRASIYGLNTWEDYYTIRQRLILGHLSNIVHSFSKDCIKDKDLCLAVKTLLAFAVDRSADYWSSLATWAGDFVAHTFGRQALPFVWDFAEVNPFSSNTGNWMGAIEWIASVIEQEKSVKNIGTGQALQADAANHPLPDDSVQAFITDPPYYYAIQYADLSDYFYVWLRRTIGNDYPELFSKEETPKKEEAIVQSPNDEYKDNVKNRAHYESVMSKALKRGREITAPNGIAVIVFANATTAGWESLINSLLLNGWIITSSWPIDTERPGRVISSGRAVLASSVHLVCRPRENPDGSVRVDNIGDWRDVLSELPKRIHEWMPRLSEEGVVGADAIFACLGPALEIFSRYARVEKASGEQVSLKEYLEQVWAVVAKEALNMIFEGADTSGFEEDARLTAMWLWTLSTGIADMDAATSEEDENDDDEEKSSKTKLSGYTLEYDAARKIAQGLGAHIEQMHSLVEVKGDKARLLPVSERTKALFGKDESESPVASRKKKSSQMELGFMEEVEKAEQEGSWGQKNVPQLGNTRLDRLHQSMILFAANRGEALKRFLVEEGVGRDQKFWRLADSLSALYPANSDERRWVQGVLAKKKGLGF